jgi:hypothetical protein
MAIGIADFFAEMQSSAHSYLRAVDEGENSAEQASLLVKLAEYSEVDWPEVTRAQQ